jgi:hypothetical protein
LSGPAAAGSTIVGIFAPGRRFNSQLKRCEARVLSTINLLT